MSEEHEEYEEVLSEEEYEEEAEASEEEEELEEESGESNEMEITDEELDRIADTAIAALRDVLPFPIPSLAPLKYSSISFLFSASSA